MIKNLLCPRCGHPLREELNTLFCVSCLATWYKINGIPYFGDEHDKYRNQDISKFLCVAESDGWDKALYEFVYKKSKFSKIPKEDQRISDWKYLLPAHRDRFTLVIGCGHSTVPIMLADISKKVFAVDSSWKNIMFLNIRKDQQKVKNIFPIYLQRGLSLPFARKSFDLISLNSNHWDKKRSASFYNYVLYLHSLLKPDGVLQLNLNNRLAASHILNPSDKYSSYDIFTYQKIFRMVGFANIRYYAPLPYHNESPLFVVPLENTQSLIYFFRNLFPLFDMVSPEVKRSYALEYSIAKIGIRLMLFFRLAKLFKIFVPGFIIFARK